MPLFPLQVNLSNFVVWVKILFIYPQTFLEVLHLNPIKVRRNLGLLALLCGLRELLSLFFDKLFYDIQTISGQHRVLHFFFNPSEFLLHFFEVFFQQVVFHYSLQ